MCSALLSCWLAVLLSVWRGRSTKFDRCVACLIFDITHTASIGILSHGWASGTVCRPNCQHFSLICRDNDSRVGVAAFFFGDCTVVKRRVILPGYSRVSGCRQRHPRPSCDIICQHPSNALQHSIACHHQTQKQNPCIAHQLNRKPLQAERIEEQGQLYKKEGTEKENENNS